MNQKISVLGVSILLLLSGSYLIDWQINLKSESSNLRNSDNNSSGIISIPKIAGEAWYKKGDCSKNNITINEMEVYNKTGSVYVIGYNATQDTSDIFLAKYNAIGFQEWNVSLNGGYGLLNSGSDVFVNQSSGDIYIVGSIFNGTYSYYDVFIAKYLPNGHQEWNITWGHKASSQFGESIALDNKGNFYITGYNQTGGDTEIIIAKFSIETLKQEWNATWENPTLDVWEFANDITCGHYGNVYIAGYTDEDDDGDKEMVLICFGEDGVEKWNETYNVADYNVYGECVAVDSNDDVYIIGYTSNSYYNGYMVLIKYSNQSNFIRLKTWSGSFGYSKGYDIYIDLEDNVIVSVSGAENVDESKLRVIGYNPAGTQILEIGWRSNSLNSDDFISCSYVSGFNTDNFYILGHTFKEPNGNDNYILVCNPSYVMVSSGGSGGPSDDDDDDDGDDGSTEAIPGYDLYLIYAAISITSFVVIKKKMKPKLT